MPEQEITYSIAMLAAVRYLSELGFENIDEGGFSCDEGAAQIVANNGGIAHLVIARAKRTRGAADKPRESEAKMRRIAMAYLIEHPEVEELQFHIVEALVGEHATVTINASICAYHWER